MARRCAASMSEPVAGQLDLFAEPQRCTAPPRRRRRPSAPLVDELTYRRATHGECDRCADEQAAAHQAGDTVPFRRRARWVRSGGGLPTELLCTQHRADDESNR